MLLHVHDKRYNTIIICFKSLSWQHGFHIQHDYVLHNIYKLRLDSSWIFFISNKFFNVQNGRNKNYKYVYTFYFKMSGTS